MRNKGQKYTVSRRKFFRSVGTTAALGAAATNALGAPSPQRGEPIGPGPQSSSGLVKVGVVGGGFGSAFHWHLHPHSRVSAVCDIRPDRLQRLSEVYGCNSTYTNFREFLRHRDLDAVAVFTPAPLHAWMAIEAMKAGKHVISAVPVGLTVEELERILESVKQTGMKYMMAETSRFIPEILTCAEWAKAGKFGTIFYSESEYHHEGLIPLMYDDRGFPTWRFGFPPLLYPTHNTGCIIPVTGERMVEVQAVGWGDGHEILQTNRYQNPFWNGTAFFKTSQGHCSRMSVCWHIAAGHTVRATFNGDRMSYIMERPEGSPNTVAAIRKDGKTVIDSDGYPQGKVHIKSFDQPKHLEKLPEALRVKSGHGGSHTFITHEFISAIVENRHPEVNIWEAIAYTLPGIVAHQSALKGGEVLKIKDYGKAPA